MTDVETIDAELDVWMIGDLADDYEPDSEPRTLATIDEADRALRRVARLETDIGRHERLFDSRIGQMQERKAEVLGVLERERQWWLTAAERWARAHASETGSKTIRLPSGTVQFRQGRQRIEPLTKEPSETVAPEFVRVSRSWAKDAIAKATMPGPVAEDIAAPEGYVAHYAVTADGEVLGDVVRLVPVQDSCTIRAGS